MELGLYIEQRQVVCKVVVLELTDQIYCLTLLQITGHYKLVIATLSEDTNHVGIFQCCLFLSSLTGVNVLKSSLL